MKTGVIPFILLFFVIILTASCDSNKVADDYHTINNATWSADSVETFPFSIINKTQNHNIYFNIRNDHSYGFSNLWLFVTIEPPRGASVTDTIQVMLAGPSGKWTGKGFSGIYDNRILYRRNVYFPEPGNYFVHIRHGMRPPLLKGITDIGIRIEKGN